MRILVTGANGFIGSSLVPQLRARGHEVWRLVRYRSDMSRADTDVIADIRYEKQVQQAVSQCSPHLVIHLAAASAVSLSFANVEEQLAINTIGTANVLEAAFNCGAMHVIHASTSEVYGRVLVQPITEDSPRSATSPYAVSKIAAEEYIALHQRQYGWPVTIMRPFNTYGRALVNNRHFMVEKAITQALIDRHIKLADPHPVRDFMFREDHVSAYLVVVAALAAGEHRPDLCQPFNFSSGSCQDIDQVAHLIACLVGDDVVVSFSGTPDRPSDIDKLWGSYDRATNVLGWTPKWDLSRGLSQAIAEWREVLHAYRST